MCGLVGVVDLRGEPVAHETLRRMSEAVAHRGRDGEGVWVDGGVGLGHRRLAIIDLSPCGRQPMLTQDGRYAIVYNGEIYNFQELRAELQGLGHGFVSRSDTEVLLHAYQEWGAGCLGRLNGMFAFGIWDRTHRELFLARDRHGIKPLYYWSDGRHFAFASEIKSLLTLPGLERRLCLPAVHQYFTFQNVFTDETLFEGVRLLPAAHTLTVSAGRIGSPVAYWDYRFGLDPLDISEEDCVDELFRRFQSSAVRQLVSDVPVGSYLSGGMDSGSLTAVASQHLGRIHSFTAGFDLTSASGIELGFDERLPAEMMAHTFQTEHYEVVLHAGDMEHVIGDLVWHLEDLRVGQSYPNYYVARLASRFVKVVLSGAGGDELFGGYPWRYYRAAVNDDFEHYIDQYYGYWQRLLDNTHLKRVFAPIAADIDDVWTRDIFRDVFDTHANELRTPEDYINHSLYFEAKTFLHGLFVVEDKLSMAHSLETRVPFMDNDLVDFAMRCPVSLKLNRLQEVIRVNENQPGDKQGDYFRKTSDGKQILRDMMARHIPEDIVKAEKQGFSSPDASWFKGESIDFVRHRLCNGGARIYDVLDREATQGLIAEHLDGKENRRLLIWSLLNVNEWMEQVL